MGNLTNIIYVIGIITAFIGGFIGFISYSIYRKNKAHFTENIRKNLEKEINSMKKELTALEAALRIKKSKSTKLEKNYNRTREKKYLASLLRDKIEHQLSSSGENFLLDIDYYKLADKVQNINNFYNSLENIYFNKKIGIKKLSEYIISNKNISNALNAILFCDIVNFSKFVQDKGLKYSQETIEEIRINIFNIIHVVNGIIISSLGDGFLILFPNVSDAFFSSKKIAKILCTKFKLKVRFGLSNISDNYNLEELKYKLNEVHSIQNKISGSSIGISKESIKFISELEIKKKEKKNIERDNKLIEFFEIPLNC